MREGANRPRDLRLSEHDVKFHAATRYFRARPAWKKQASLISLMSFADLGSAHCENFAIGEDAVRIDSSKFTTAVSTSIVLAALTSASPAFAYVGPGLSAAAVLTVLGVLFSIVLAAFALIYYPLKRALKKRKAKSGSAPTTSSMSASPTDSAES